MLIVFGLFIFTNFYVTNEVSAVIDGDTIKLKDGKVVRLLGINSPEIDESCYKEAKDKLNEMVEGKEIRLETDSEERDSYGRLLRYVFVGDVFVNAEMVRLGYAKVFGDIEKYSNVLIEMEDKAKIAKRCVWS